MSGIYEYQYHDSPYYGGSSITSIDEYLDRVNRMHRTPTMIEEVLEAPQARRPHHNNSAHPQKHGDHRVKIFQENYQQYQAPEVHRKVHFTEQEKHVEIDRHDKHEVFAERTVDMEADGFIQRRHKSFDSCNTFKGY